MTDKNTAMKNKKQFRTIDLVYIAMSVALITVCSWIQIPATIPFTLQTFAVFLTVSLLGGWRANVAVLVYILLGALGAPVFASFKGGIGALMGPTGGYIFGFMFIAGVMWLMESIVKKAQWLRALSMLIGVILCYAFGTLWFMNVYVKEDGTRLGLTAVLGICVLPFILPDIIKLLLALIISNNKALRRTVKS